MRLRPAALIVTLTLGILAAPLAADAQQAGKVYRIGFLASASPSVSQPFLGAFRDGLRELGYVDGQNVIIEQRWAEGAPDRLSDVAAELVRMRVDLIFAWATPAVTATKQATSTLPIVMVGVSDPVGLGFVSSLARPGANITGVSNLARDLSGKLLELLDGVKG